MTDTFTVRASSIPEGLCQCGCGQRTKVATHTDRAKGWRRGRPLKYRNGHNLKAAERGPENHNWKGGRRKTSHGYITIRQPDGSRKYEHNIIAEQVLGRPLKFVAIGHPDNEVVHHIDGDKTNNAKSNLLVCTHSYHVALHARLEESDDWPQFVKSGRMQKMWAANRRAWADPERRAKRIAAIKAARR